MPEGPSLFSPDDVNQINHSLNQLDLNPFPSLTKNPGINHFFERGGSLKFGNDVCRNVEEMRSVWKAQDLHPNEIVGAIRSVLASTGVNLDSPSL